MWLWKFSKETERPVYRQGGGDLNGTDIAISEGQFSPITHRYLDFQEPISVLRTTSRKWKTSFLNIFSDDKKRSQWEIYCEISIHSY